jgi:hypothetical protein
LRITISTSTPKSSGWPSLHPDAVNYRTGGRDFHTLRNLDPLADPLVVRHHKLASATDPELSHHGGMGSLQNLHDLAIGAAIRLDAGDVYHDPVAVHRLLGAFWRDKHISGNSFNRPFRDQKAVTVLVHVEASDGELAVARRHGEMARAKLDKLATRGQPRESVFEILARGAFGAQFAHQLLEAGPRMRQLCDVLDQRRIPHKPILPVTRV